MVEFPTMLAIIRRTARVLFVMIILAVLMGGSIVPPGNQTEQVRAFTRQIEFDYVGWTINALGIKFQQIALGSGDYLTGDSRRQMVLDYMSLVAEIQAAESQLNDIYADPTIGDPFVASGELRNRLQTLYARRSRLGPLAESILQGQVSDVVAEMGLTLGGQPIPPVLFHSTPLPLALIISPRNVIRQDEDISLAPDLTIDQRADLENQVDTALDVSSLVVNIGGVGLYPTMVYQTSYLNGCVEVVAHEWTHNFLTLRPLGINYLASPELRTMNETTASIAGKEIGRAILEKYYPELAPPPEPTNQPAVPTTPTEPPAFNFNAEMRTTRLKVDALLAEGEIHDAETYMEARREFFWDNGYHIRKLNQAYFAFNGAYADQPGGGAAGADPVGAAVRQLRTQSATLGDFLNQISWMATVDQLYRAVSYQPEGE
jgi:hypothetical protein